MGSERADFAAQLARERAAAKLSLANLAEKAHVHRGYLHNVEHGRRWPSEDVTRALDAALNADGALLATWDAANRVPSTCHTDGQLTELLELAARAEASDVGSTTLELLDLRVDEMARAYTRAPPAELLRDVRASLGLILLGRLTAQEVWAARSGEHRA
jgi:transcriptional regulator with XRE-family HTH domain